MSDRQRIIDRDLTERHALIDILLTNPEEFHVHASTVLRNYTQNERTLVTHLLSAKRSALDFFDDWEANIKDLREEINEARTNKSFARSLAKYLHLTGPQSNISVEALVKQRDAQIVEHFLDKHYPSEQRRLQRARQAAKHILRYSPEHIESVRSHYISATLVYGVSREYGVTVVDPQEGRYAQFKARRAIREERADQARSDARSIKRLTKQIKSLRRESRGLVGVIADLPVEFITIVSAKSQYEKKLARKQIGAAEIPDTRVTLFDEATASLRETYIATLDSSLTAKQKQAQLSQYADTLWRIFMMSSGEINQLMTRLGQLRTLQDQISTITQAADRRAATLAQQ